jgi:hypothetical protein
VARAIVNIDGNEKCNGGKNMNADDEVNVVKP